MNRLDPDKPCTWRDAMSTRQILYYGQKGEAPIKSQLRAGPLSMNFNDGDLHRIRLDGIEVLRRLCAVVRGPNWETLPRTITSCTIDSRENTFRIDCECESRWGGIDFRWKLLMEGLDEGTILWSMDGKAYSSFLANRVGLCLLHPIAGVSGKPFVIASENGRSQRLRFPLEIAPQPIFTNAEAIGYQIDDHTNIEISLSGDLFEGEDQRNWTDASFKTYSRPLRLPYRFPVEHGAAVRQSAHVKIDGRRRRNPGRLDRPSHITLRISESRSAEMPSLGLGISAVWPSTDQISRLRDLKLSFLSVELDASNPLRCKRLEIAATLANLLEIPLEIRITCTADRWEAEYGQLERLLQDARVCRWLIDVDANSANSAPFESHDSAEMLFGSAEGFVGLNRKREIATLGDGVWFPISPQVHASDHDSLIENLVAQGWVVRQARELAKGRGIAVSRVTLKQHLLDTTPDARQTSLFGAVWTVGSLKYIAENSADSISFFEIVGGNGIMPLAEETHPPELDGAVVYPMFHILADVAEFQPAAVLTSLSSQPLLVDGLVLRAGERIRLLLSNFSEDSQKLSIEMKTPCVWTSSKCLEEANCLAAMAEPGQYRAAAPQLITAEPENALRLSLPPLSVTTIDGYASFDHTLAPGRALQ